MDVLKRLYIEPTSHCNLECEMCFRHTWFDENFNEMSFELFEMILDSIPKETDTIFFGGMGEPLCHPRIIDMVRKCKAKNYNVELLTNGSLLTEYISTELLEGGLSKLWISMDDIGSVNNNVIGHQNNYNIIDNIQVFNRIRSKGYRRVKLGITFVATRSNVHQLADLPMLIRKYNIVDVNVSNLYPSDFEAQKEILYEKSLNMSVGSDSYRKPEAKVSIPFMDFNLPEVQTGLAGILSNISYDLELSNSKMSRHSNHCRFIEEGMCFVRSDGNVSPCMELLHNGITVLENTERKVYHHSFGNIGLMGLNDIWESKEYTNFRNKVKKFDFSHCLVCGHCEYAEENLEDCNGNNEPTCGACLWAEGFLSCP